MNITSLNRVEKKIRGVFFDVLIEVGQSLVTKPALVADILFLEVLLGANWKKAVGACLDINRLKIAINKEKLRLKKLPNPSEDFVGAGFKMYASERVEVNPGGFTVCEVVHFPVPQEELCFVNSKAGSEIMFNVFEH